MAWNPHGDPPTAQAIDSAHRYLEQDALVKQITIAHQPNPALVNQWAELATTPAFGNRAGLRLELNQKRVVGG